MKRLLYVLMIVTVLLAGCASGGEKEFSLSPEELGQTIFEKAEFTDQLTLLPKESLYRLYDLDSSLVEDSCLYVGTGSTAEEIAVFRMKDAGGVEAAKAAIEKRIAYQTDNFKDYVPAEVPKLEKAVVKTGGTTVVFVVSANADGTKSVIDSLYR